MPEFEVELAEAGLRRVDADHPGGRHVTFAGFGREELCRDGRGILGGLNGRSGQATTMDGGVGRSERGGAFR
jgi:hypothetical protein